MIETCLTQWLLNEWSVADVEDCRVSLRSLAAQFKRIWSPSTSERVNLPDNQNLGVRAKGMFERKERGKGKDGRSSSGREKSG